MVKKYLLEAVVDSLEAALAAEAAGADRLELCSALELGGLTPGFGLLRAVCARVRIPVHVLVRSRGGSFTCTPSEFETLLAEAAAAREAGAAGIVAGILTDAGRIDVARMATLVRAAAPLPVTFHRAFDRTGDRTQALADLQATGCHRLLSSGLAETAAAGAETLGWLRQQGAGSVVVMPGGGVTAANVAALAAQTQAVEFHFSAIERQADGRWTPAPHKVHDIRQALDTYFANPS